MFEMSTSALVLNNQSSINTCVKRGGGKARRQQATPSKDISRSTPTFSQHVSTAFSKVYRDKDDTKVYLFKELPTHFSSDLDTLSQPPYKICRLGAGEYSTQSLMSPNNLTPNITDKTTAMKAAKQSSLSNTKQTAPFVEETQEDTESLSVIFSIINNDLSDSNSTKTFTIKNESEFLSASSIDKEEAIYNQKTVSGGSELTHDTLLTEVQNNRSPPSSNGLEDGERTQLISSSAAIDCESLSDSTESDTEKSPTKYWSFPVTELNIEDDEIFTVRSSDEEAEPQIPTTVESSENDLVDSSGASDINSWWLYKKFQKGPKGTHFNIVLSPSDPHKPIEFSDPAVVSPGQEFTPPLPSSRKPRLGNGNDVTPDSNLLKRLQCKITSITEKINSLTDASQKKEKMKLSSRLSRVRRRANHEANKIIFAGIEQERDALSKVVKRVRTMMVSSQNSGNLLEKYKNIVKDLPEKVAGRKAHYVNSVLEPTEVGLESSD